ncbi:MAG: 50S ribosomal protein L14 [Candidatus Handelsmanbacteria bacterium RIFCSPLOWO2_12_FULL_64_10]|uniref:Large ribosomal subunit protein uL14 n=1 Tax=Handelsmanbacteria sp. (strain RIFCSPLOWO2_12_FULL_64_10) TaxID=1817868 RepID=A0A1F6C9T5_HANXR|nr:ribosomal protein L14 [uncultured bacterium]OGG45943.1 MAG: 50S ribosomal protein L14 [Candidatus Handelsmanbacteria bacterium RIFCSPLOWO2_12_FULL_64_10]
MLQVKSLLDVADNSGARAVAIFGVLGFSSKRYARVGDIVRGSVKKALPGSPLKRGDKVKGVVVRTRNPFKRNDGTWIRFDSNALVILDDELKPRGTRVFGAVPRELRQNFMRIITLAAEVV